MRDQIILQNDNQRLILKLSSYEIYFMGKKYEAQPELKIIYDIYRVFSAERDQIVYQQIPTYNIRVLISGAKDSEIDGVYGFSDMPISFENLLSIQQNYSLSENCSLNPFFQKRGHIVYRKEFLSINTKNSVEKHSIERQAFRITKREVITCLEQNYLTLLFMNKEKEKGLLSLISSTEAIFTFYQILTIQLISLISLYTQTFNNFSLLILITSFYAILLLFWKFYHRLTAVYYYEPFIKKRKLIQAFIITYILIYSGYIPHFILKFSKDDIFSFLKLPLYCSLFSIILFMYYYLIKNVSFSSFFSHTAFLENMKNTIKNNRKNQAIIFFIGGIAMLLFIL